jgi:hypothetical protein
VRCRRPPALTTFVAAAAVSLFVAACGSSSPGSPSSASAGGQPTQAKQMQDAVNFADCMRSRGVPNFPDPTSSPREFKQSLSPSTPRSPSFLSAARACQHLLPGGGPDESRPHTQAQIAAMLAFVRCLRSHGFPTFPDPTSSGQLTHEMLSNAGINLQQPAVIPAADACVVVTHGFITKADVARFVAGQ